MKKDNLILKLVAGMLLLMVSPPLLCHAAINQILYMAKYNGTPVFGTDTLGGVTYSTITYGDLINGGEPGMPSLPIDYLKFSVPYNATNFTVTTTLSSNWPYYIDHLLYPCQAPRMMNDTTPVVITLPDTAAYYSGSTYPTQAAWVVDEGFLEGENHIVTVAVMPFQYVHSASSDLIAQKRTVTVKLRYDLSDTLAMYPIVRNDSLLREEGYQLTRSMVVNPSQVKTYAPSHINAGFDSLNIVQGGIGGEGLNGFDPPTPTPNLPDSSTYNMYEHEHNYPYLIVTTSDLCHSMRRIAALKRQKGYNVKVVTMDEVMNAPFAQCGDRFRQSDGSYHVAYEDPAGVLRQFLRFYYFNYGTKNVLLAGASIPYRITDIITEKTINNVPTTVTTSDVLTDQYFCDLNADWSSQGSDRYSELYVGRITARDDVQINNYTDKLFRYALNPGNGDHSYLRRAFFSEGRGFNNYLIEFRQLLDSIYSNKIIINDSAMSTSDYPTGKVIIDTIRTSPVGFMSIFNHGDTTRVRVYGPDSNNRDHFIYATKPIEAGNGLNCLQNKNYPMIYYSISCVTMPFDNNVLTLGDSFVLGKDYGGPVYIGYTRGVNADQIQQLGKAFANKIRESNGKLGEAYALAKVARKISSREATFIQGYLGDPQLELWSDNPHSYSNIIISRSDSSVTINNNDSVSAKVAYCTNDLHQGYSVMQPHSNLTFNISPNSSIMLYGHNCIPYFAPLELQNITITKSQYVIASDVICGSQVNTDRKVTGDVIVKNGIEYEIEASGTVTLEDSFKVEKGATFAVYPSSF